MAAKNIKGEELELEEEGGKEEETVEEEGKGFWGFSLTICFFV